MGLGLPGFSPGSADRNQLKQAVKKSDSDLVERTMLEDKIRATGESILIFLRENPPKNHQKGIPIFISSEGNIYFFYEYLTKTQV